MNKVNSHSGESGNVSLFLFVPKSIGLKHSYLLSSFISLFSFFVLFLLSSCLLLLFFCLYLLRDVAHRVWHAVLDSTVVYSLITAVRMISAVMRYSMCVCSLIR